MQTAKFVLLGSSLIFLFSCFGKHIETISFADITEENTIPISALARWEIKSHFLSVTGKGFFALFPGRGVRFEESGPFGTLQVWILLPDNLILYDTANKTKKEINDLSYIGLKDFKPVELLGILSKEKIQNPVSVNKKVSYRYKNAKITYVFAESPSYYNEVNILRGTFSFTIAITNIHNIEKAMADKLLSVKEQN